MPKIQVLPPSIAQTIAAGEVVERPASAVKELVENAIDAGSTDVLVELRKGGLDLIRVRDNGEGIEAEDLPRALERYATSKLRAPEDLFAIRTMGFRGEALPSIASVSRMTIKTRVHSSLAGMRILCEAGRAGTPSEAGCPEGTEVEVRDLFYNIPVKRRFLKSIQTELRHCLSHFLRLSLSYPGITFKFLHDGKMLYELLKTDNPLVRIEGVLGRETCRNLRAFAFEDGEIRISGYASLSVYSKGNGEGIYTYVNRRFVRDRLIYRAVLDSYRHLIPSGRFPVVILSVSVPPSLVDVNVHPTKAEVKFREQERIFQAVHRGLRLSHEQEAPSAEPPPVGPREFQAPFISGRNLLPLPVSYPVRFGPDSSQNSVAPPMVMETGPGAERNVPFHLLGQVRETYLVWESKEAILFVDQHACHERIIFERLKKEVQTGSIEVRRFLFPIPMEFSAGESLTLASYLGAFEALGFEIDPVGGSEFVLRSIPVLIDEKEAPNAVREVLDELLLLEKEAEKPKQIERLLVSLACRSAIKANYPLNREEMVRLIEDFSRFPLSSTCPHGRPIAHMLPIDELARCFKRKPPPAK
jgi:DNA mismatch repair protein MutL